MKNSIPRLSNRRSLFLKIFIILLSIGILSEVYTSSRDNNKYEEEHHDDHELEELEEYLNNKMTSFPSRRPNVEPVKHELYTQECSDCHFLYSRGMLPSRSWKKLMQPQELANHFDEVIELEETDRQQILTYLVANSAEKSKYKISKQINRSIKEKDTPIRISKVRYIRRQHHDIPEKYISMNAKVISLSQCNACHQRVVKGIIDESEVYIPYEKLKPAN